ncbi:MAG TPA: YceD family protein, partial [Spongiibacteraceae bacterium]|nr:YceD family protein [Spongiibacteraceae bacterium]
MQNTPLPKQVDVRRLVAADISIEAREPLANFVRLTDMLEASDGEVEVQLHFYIDQQGTKCIDGAVQATLMVLCQRCLKPLALPVDARFKVAVVWSDEAASRLPKELEPYIVGEEPQDVRELVEDELIISVPYVSYHDEGQCVADGYEKLAEI